MAKRSIKSSENVNITRYTPTEWATGDVITAEKLNNMESGISAAAEAAESAVPFIVTFAGTTDSHNAECDNPFTEISAAIIAGRNVVLRYLRNVDADRYYQNLEMRYVRPALGGIEAIIGEYYFLNDDGTGVRIICDIDNGNNVTCTVYDIEPAPNSGGGDNSGDAK